MTSPQTREEAGTGVAAEAGLRSAASRAPQAQPVGAARQSRTPGQWTASRSAPLGRYDAHVRAGRGGATHMQHPTPPHPPRHREAGEVALPASVRVVRSAPPSPSPSSSIPPPTLAGAVGAFCSWCSMRNWPGGAEWPGAVVGQVSRGSLAGARGRVPGRVPVRDGTLAVRVLVRSYVCQKWGACPSTATRGLGRGARSPAGWLCLRWSAPGQLAVGLFLARLSLCCSRPAGPCSDARWWRALLQGHCRREQRWWPAASGTGAGQAQLHPLGALAARARGVARLDGPLCGAAAPGWSRPRAGTGSGLCGGRSRVSNRVGDRGASGMACPGNGGVARRGEGSACGGHEGAGPTAFPSSSAGRAEHGTPSGFSLLPKLERWFYL